MAKHLWEKGHAPFPGGGNPGHPRAPYGKRTGASNKDMRWVAKHYGIQEVLEGEAPSQEAWNLLLAVRSDDGVRRAFWTRYLPAKEAVVKAVERSGGDGGGGEAEVGLELIEELLQVEGVVPGMPK